MLPKLRKTILAALLLGMLFLLSGCKQNPSEQQLYARMTEYFETLGYTCSFSAVEENTEVPIYLPSSWKALRLDGEEALVYFDESNRADYLASLIDAETYSFVGQFGLRFVLVYRGSDPGVLQALQTMPEV